MRVIDTVPEFWERPHASQRRRIYDEIVAKGAGGKTVELVAGEDFPDDGDPNRYRQQVLAAMRHRNLDATTRIVDGNIRVRILGTL